MDTKTLIEEELSQAGETFPIIAQLRRQVCELKEECQKLNSELMAFKQEKIKEKNHYNNSKMDFEKESENNSQKGRKEAFIPPTLEEVRAYMDEIGENGFTAERFWNYYEAKGWVLGKAKMKFWKRVLDNWTNGGNERSKKLKGAKTPAQRNIVTFNAYKPVEIKGAVSYEEYVRMKKEGLV